MDTSNKVVSQTPDSPEVFVPPSSTGKPKPISIGKDKELGHGVPQAANTPIDPKAVALKFRVEKCNALGLLMPQSQKLLFRSVDPATDADLGSAFSTSKMSYIDAMSGLPPPYEVHTARENSPPQPVARILPMGWQGLTSCKVELECWAPRPDLSPESERGKVQRGKWLIERTLRTYKCTLVDGQGLQEFSWKGATSAVKDIQRQAKEQGKERRRVHKGNFKCVSKDGEMLALWVQARSLDDLGDLYIFEAAKGKLAAEVILASVPVPVMGERVTGMNWIGGFGKSI